MKQLPLVERGAGMRHAQSHHVADLKVSACGVSHMSVLIVDPHDRVTRGQIRGAVYRCRHEIASAGRGMHVMAEVSPPGAEDGALPLRH